MPSSTLAIIGNHWYKCTCCCMIVVGEMIVPSTSAQYSVSTSVTFHSFESHWVRPFTVHAIATSSTFMPHMGNGLMSSYAVIEGLILATFLLAPVSFWTVSVHILNDVLLFKFSCIVAFDSLILSTFEICQLYEMSFVFFRSAEWLWIPDFGVGMLIWCGFSDGGESLDDCVNRTVYSSL